MAEWVQTVHGEDDDGDVFRFEENGFIAIVTIDPYCNTWRVEDKQGIQIDQGYPADLEEGKQQSLDCLRAFVKELEEANDD